MVKKIIPMTVIIGILFSGTTGCVQSRKHYSTVSDAVEQLKDGEKVRIVSMKLGLLEGKFRSSTGTTVQMFHLGDEVDVPFSDIEAIEVRRASVKQGANGGAIVFAILGGLAGATLDGLVRGLDESEDPEGCPGCIVGGVVFGAMTGGV